MKHTPWSRLARKLRKAFSWYAERFSRFEIELTQSGGLRQL